MASFRELKDKQGNFLCYEFRHNLDGKWHTMRWKPDATWSVKYMEKERSKALSRFEEDVKSGKHLTKHEQKIQKQEQMDKENAIPTFKEYAENSFLVLKKQECKRGTITTYKIHLDLYIYPYLGDLKITDITTNTLDTFFSSMSEKYAYNTAKMIHKIVSGIMGLAYRKDVIDRNPMDKANPLKRNPQELIDNESDEVDAMDETEIAAFLKAVENEPLRWKTYFILSYETGCRKGEIFGIQRDCFNAEDGSIAIKRIVEYDAIKKEHYVDTPKSRKARTVYVSPGTAKLVQELFDSQKADGVISPWLFWNRVNPEELPCPSAANSWLKNFCLKNGLKHAWPHKLRHTHASIAIRNGVDVITVSRNLGHSKPSITVDLYSHSTDEARKQINSVLRNVTCEQA